ncbi:MAG: DinB family protein, partial [Bacteroidota bacterium]
MKHNKIIQQLSKNKTVFESLLSNRNEAEVKWKPFEDQWCMLEVVCHLVDEEKEDFRARVEYVLRDPDEQLPMFDPQKWVTERDYIGQDFETKLTEFLDERTYSVNWLKSLKDSNWQNTYHHPKLGPMTAELFLANWLAHDHIHIR